MHALPDAVCWLIEKFDNDADHYLSQAYNETLCRVDFINPMFEALGWDMANRAGYADAYRDVIHEDAIKIGGAMLSIHRQTASARTAHEKDALQRQIDATDSRIDRLVYELYGLTEDEIRIVEEATAGRS